MSEYKGIKITEEAYSSLISMTGKLQAERKERVTISETILELTKIPRFPGGYGWLTPGGKQRYDWRRFKCKDCLFWVDDKCWQNDAFTEDVDSSACVYFEPRDVKDHIPFQFTPEGET